MFTGLVEGQGSVQAVLTEGAGVRLQIGVPAEIAASGCNIGDSVAINGCCLTVVELVGNRLTFQAGPETLAKTNLGKLKQGMTVNLERPLTANARLGGHFVQGHVDGVGQLDQIVPNGDWVTMWFRVPEQMTRCMVPKGSIAVDGISLTLVDVERDRFSVALIPHTLQVTTLGNKQPGDPVNIETDLLAKYVQKLVGEQKT